MDLCGVARNIIDSPGVTGNEGEVGRFLTSYLGGLDYRVETQEVAPDRFNVIATRGDRARVVFSTHLDTVPPFIPSHEDEENIYGRGACDAKGIIAAQIFAAERLRAEGLHQTGLLFTVDEELA